MSDDDVYDDELDDDEELIDDSDDFLEDLVTHADMKKKKSLEARRRIENWMELRRLREIDESIGLEDLD